MGISVRNLLRKNTESYEQMCVEEDRFSDDELPDAMLTYPVLINWPVVVSSSVRNSAVPLKWFSIFCRIRSRERSSKKTVRR